MFLWSLPWTNRVILALLTCPSPSPSGREWKKELLFDVVLWIPLMVILGQVYIRIAASLSVPKPLRSIIPPAVWTLGCQLVAADLVFWALLMSVASRLDLTTPTISAGWNDHWGWNGPFMVFTVRILLSFMGLTVGESFFPLALTGGIACGKSTISKVLQQRNVHMIDADKIGHLILLPPWHEELSKKDALVSSKDSVYVDILEAFASDNTNRGTGSAVPGVNEDHPLLNERKEIDRAKLGAKIFANPMDRKKLNAITHRRIFYCLLKTMTKSIYFGRHTWVCAEIPLLFESGSMRYIFGLALVVACTPSQQLERLRKRNPELTAEECQKRIDSQMPMTIKVKQADIVLWNDQNHADPDATKVKPDPKDATVNLREEALSKQVDKAVQMIQQRVKGLLDTNLTQLLVLLSGSMVISACFKLIMGKA